MDPCPGGQAVKVQKYGYNWLQRAVQLSLRVEDWGGVRTQIAKGKYPEIQLK